MLLELWKKFALLTGHLGRDRQHAPAARRRSATIPTCVRSSCELMQRDRRGRPRRRRARSQAISRPNWSSTVAAFPPAMKASMANDLDAGNRLELDWLAGKVVGARPQARRADADPRGGVRDPQAVPDGPRRRTLNARATAAFIATSVVEVWVR